MRENIEVDTCMFEFHPELNLGLPGRLFPENYHHLPYDYIEEWYSHLDTDAQIIVRSLIGCKNKIGQRCSSLDDLYDDRNFVINNDLCYLTYDMYKSILRNKRKLRFIFD